MRFMIIRKADADTEAGIMPSERLIADMLAYNQTMADAGVLVAGEGLQPSAKGARIKFSGGKPRITDGPFAQPNELMAGYTMIEVKSRQEALDWASRWPASDGGGEVELELRQVFSDEDFGAEFTPELREQEARMRDQLERHG